MQRRLSLWQIKAEPAPKVLPGLTLPWTLLET